MKFSSHLCARYLLPTLHLLRATAARLPLYLSPQRSYVKTVNSDLPFPTRKQDPDVNVTGAKSSGDIKQFIQDVANDLNDLEQFYDISISRSRTLRFGQYLVQRQNEVSFRPSRTLLHVC